jgi:hypothetical protein
MQAEVGSSILTFLKKTKSAQRNPIWTTSAYHPGKCGMSPIGRRTNKSQVIRKIKNHKQATTLLLLLSAVPLLRNETPAPVLFDQVSPL